MHLDRRGGTLRGMRLLWAVLLALVAACGGQTHDGPRVVGDGAVECPAGEILCGYGCPGSPPSPPQCVKGTGCVVDPCIPPDDTMIDATSTLVDATANGDETSHTGICEGDCLCWTFDACPVDLGCYPSQTALRNGALDAFCGNGIVECNASGTAWSIGTPTNNCSSGETAVDVDGGPTGAVCCATETAEPVDDGGSADAVPPPELDASGNESDAVPCPEGEVLCPTYCTNPGYSVCTAVGDAGCPGPPFDCAPPK